MRPWSGSRRAAWWGRRISASGAVGPERTLSVSTGTELAQSPVVAVDPAGRALVVWSEYRGGYHTVGRYFYQDGTLGPVIQFGSGVADTPSVAVGRNGQAVVAWAESYSRVVARRVTPGSVSALKAFTSTLSGVGGYARVAVAVDRDGDAIVSYRRWHNGELPRVWVRRWSRTNTLGTVTAVSPSTDNVTPYHSLAMDLDGDAMVVWSRRQDGAIATGLYGRFVSRTGSLGAVSRLGIGDRPDIALDDDGDGVLVLHTPGPPYDANQVYTRSISRSGVFGTAVRLSTDGRVPQVDTSPTGRDSVTWQQKSHPYGIKASFGS